MLQVLTLGQISIKNKFSGTLNLRIDVYILVFVLVRNQTILFSQFDPKPTKHERTHLIVVVF